MKLRSFRVVKEEKLKITQVSSFTFWKGDEIIRRKVKREVNTGGNEKFDFGHGICTMLGRNVHQVAVGRWW